MVNDITTLNGSLRELGETMAANLTTQGVPSTYDEGLTTLAGKILDIQGGVRTLTLVSDKDILSYYDEDTATLTATLLEGGEPVAKEYVEFFNGSTSLGTALTNANGVATKTYSSQGIGDIEISASVGSISSETYSIQDCLFYDDATSNKVANYTSTNARLTYDTDHYESFASPIGIPSNYFAFTNPKASLNLPRDIEVELDVMQVGTLNGQWGVSFTDSQEESTSTNYAICGAFTNVNKGIICNSPWGAERTNGALSLNTWYHFKITVTGTTVNFLLTNENTVLFNNSLTVSFMSELTYLNVHQGQASNTIQFKNLKIKPL